MELRLQIHRDQAGTWSIKGLPEQSVARFDDLSEALEYAKRECAWAPALIEFFVDGVYVVVNQEEGWPHRLCRPASAPKFAGIRDRLRRCGDRWDARPSSPSAGEIGEDPRVAVRCRHRLGLPRFSGVEELKNARPESAICGKNVSALFRLLLTRSTPGRACGFEFSPSSS